MAEIADQDFSGWLNGKLRELNTDESVFGSYITGILEDEDSADEKREALQDILSQIVEDADGIEVILEEIFRKWESSRPAKSETQPKPFESIDIDAQLAKLLESKAISATVQKQQLSAEEMRIRDQILAQYSQVEMDECDDEDDGGPPPAGAGAASSIDNDPLMEKNTNAADVAQLVKDRREQAKVDSKAKKDKDKEDREKQKKDREDKKNSRKTVKGERRR